MKVVFSLLMLIAASMNAGELMFNVNTPIADFDLKIRYSNNAISNDSVNLICYAFSESNKIPNAIEVNLRKDMFGTYISEMRIPQSVVYLLFKVEDIDDNYGNFWELLVYDSSLKPLKNAAFVAGLSYLGNNSAEYRVNPDFAKAQEYFNQELKQFPDNFRAEIALNVLKFDTKRISYQEFEKNLKKILAKKPPVLSEEVARTLSRAYKVLNMNDESISIEKEFAKNNSRSGLAEELLMIELSKAPSFEKFSALAVDFIKSFPESSNLNRVSSALVNSYLQANKYEELLNLIEVNNIESPEIFTALAFEFRSNKKVSPKLDDSLRAVESINIMRRAISIFDSKRTVLIQKPSDITKKEFVKQERINAAYLFESMSELYRSLDKNQAIEYLERALNLYGDAASKNIYIKLLDYYKSEEKFSNCIALTESAIINGYTDSLFQSLHKSFYSKMVAGESESDYQITLANLIKAGNKARKRMLIEDEVKINAPKIVLNNINGGFFDTEDLKDSLTAVFFWSSWCEPCKKTISTFEDLELYYFEKASIRFIAVNVWDNFDNKHDDLKKFAVSFGTNMNIFFDINDLAGAKFNLTGLPTIALIDKRGVIRFVERGVTNDDDFFDSMLEKIDYLLSE